MTTSRQRYENDRDAPLGFRRPGGIAAADLQIERLEVGDHDYEAPYANASTVIDDFQDLYQRAPAATRRLCNRAIFERLYFRQHARLTPLGSELLERGQVRTWGQVPTPLAARAAAESLDVTEDDADEDDEAPGRTTLVRQ